MDINILLESCNQQIKVFIKSIYAMKFMVITLKGSTFVCNQHDFEITQNVGILQLWIWKLLISLNRKP
jgi:hypothetical protein